MLNVFSTFLSLQGESIFQGKPCYFIRLAGCSLKCVYCDSREACVSPGVQLSVDEILDLVAVSKVNVVEVTGGEPLIQQASFRLLSRLSDVFKHVLLETNGSLSVEHVDPRVHVVMDVKCPDSGMGDSFFLNNLILLEDRSHELKFVISSKRDFDWVCGFVSENGLYNRELVVSPSFSYVSIRDLADWVLSGPYPFRIQTQLHKLIWPEGEKEKRLVL